MYISVVVLAALAMDPGPGIPPLTTLETEANAPSLSNSLEAIDRDLLSFVPEGLGELKVRSKNGSFEVGRLFWDEKADALFARVPAALALFQEARSLKTTGNILSGIGLFADIFLGGGLALVGALTGQFVVILAAAGAILLIALPFAIAGAIVSSLATSKLLTAVDTYNHGLLQPEIAHPKNPGTGGTLQPEGGAVLFQF